MLYYCGDGLVAGLMVRGDHRGDRGLARPRGGPGLETWNAPHRARSTSVLRPMGSITTRRRVAAHAPLPGFTSLHVVHMRIATPVLPVRAGARRPATHALSKIRSSHNERKLAHAPIPPSEPVGSHSYISPCSSWSWPPRQRPSSYPSSSYLQHCRPAGATAGQSGLVAMCEKASAHGKTWCTGRRVRAITFALKT